MAEQQAEKTCRLSGPRFGPGIAGRCPSCHRGKLYAGYLTLAPKC